MSLTIRCDRCNKEARVTVPGKLPQEWENVWNKDLCAGCVVELRQFLNNPPPEAIAR
jgi:hypothetical protein